MRMDIAIKLLTPDLADDYFGSATPQNGRYSQ